MSEILVTSLIFMLLAASELGLGQQQQTQKPQQQNVDNIEMSIYDKMFENMDVNSLLKNHRLVDSYLKCFLNEGSCTHIGHEVKMMIPEVIRSRCATCGENQMRALKAGLRLFIVLRPDDWKRFLDVYDPDRTEWPHIKAFMESDD
uniref:Chemosensory protein 5 n=1 Tax=Sogatella furcifera TaxID=113103 RepID=W8E1S6_SOGFU|nr:chemosensory protein 5 [Sogatella furcifera]